mgnify:CR=1 FL=1
MNRQKKYNNETLEQLWMSTIADTHEMICECDRPYAHLLANIFPLGHQDRNKTINHILLRDYREKCRSSGVAGDGFGGTTTETDIKKEEGADATLEGPDDEELGRLLAAAAAEVEESAR